jgi:hypothetical protein
VGFRHPDFQKLIEYTKSSRLRLFVSFIAWEERRTQFLTEAESQISKVRKEFDALSRKQADNFILLGLPAPAIDLWEQSELEARSHEAMTNFAKDNNIVVVHLGPDHAQRAWGRYFRTELPFNAGEPDREQRRKDIPDSWILEAAIDIKRDNSSLIALCCDKRFSAALKEVLEIDVFEEAQSALDHIDQMGHSVRTPATPEIVSSITYPPGEALTAVFRNAESQFKEVATKIIGLIAYLGTPTKEQIYSILEESGIPIQASKNVADQLVFMNTIVDTGHHYISGDKDAGEQAKPSVESEMIRLAMNGK